MRQIRDGALYALGALLMCTLWSLVAYGIIELTEAHRQSRMELDKAEFNEILDGLTPGPNDP